MTVLSVKLPNDGYNITLGRGLLGQAGELFKLNRRALIVTDEGVPSQYAEKIKLQAATAKIVTVPMGEGSKSFKYLEYISQEMLNFGLTRSDCVVAVGGGVVGDLAGFAAASYMRGIDFYNVPTTVLAATDSSVGGKCAINLGETKNVIGAFYQPRAVLIDFDTFKTLDTRQISAGLAEALKMSMTSDRELFEFFENCEFSDTGIEKIIESALKIKIDVVEKDEKESGLRRILNFGHTLGHGIEAECFGKLYHGECVGMGMLPFTAESLRPRLVSVLKKLNLPTEIPCPIDAALSHVCHDKKAEGEFINAVFVNEIGSFEIRKMRADEFSDYVKKNV